MIRVVHILGAMNMAGIETFIMNLYRNVDKNKVQFDFIIHTYNKCDYEDEIVNLGGKIHRVTRKSKNPIKSFKEVYRIIKVNNYKIVHRHANSSFLPTLDLLAAKFAGCKTLISHSHNTNDNPKWLHFIFQPIMNKLVTHRFACSEVAGKWMFKKKKFEIINNAINLEKFKYDSEIRDKIRQEYNIGMDMALCHVGRFNVQKNHSYLLEIVKSVIEKDENVKLFLIGDGELREEIQHKIRKLNLEKNVVILGKKDNISDILQGMDVFVFPSFFEGLPVTLVEAQATGLPCIISDKITSEICLTDIVKRLPIYGEDDKWVEEILSVKDKERKITTNLIIKSGYDIKQLSLKMQNFYLNEGTKK